MSFEKSVKHVLDHEGGYVNHPSDPGGETKYGISKRSYPNFDIRNLTLDQAKMIYKKDYWDKIKGDQLPDDVAFILFDMAVNLGIFQAVKLLQKAVDTVQDGILGPMTIKAIKEDTPAKLTFERIMFYSSLANFKVFGRGWTNRSIDTLVRAIS
jgi:lysozyme family protein